MKTEILKSVEEFQRELNLSDHRVGIILAKNGRLLERLRGGGRIWPETEAEIAANIATERDRRAQNLAHTSASAA